MGIWSDAHVEPLARIARFVAAQGAVAGIQLAHAGRKASCDLPWKGGRGLLTPEAGGWTVVAPSPIPFSDGDPPPVALDEAGIDGGRRRLRRRRPARRRRRLPGDRDPRRPRLPAPRVPLAAEQPAGPTTTAAAWRTGCGSTLEVAERLRGVLPDELPLFVRISATDWVEGGWDLDQSVELAKRLKALGVDLIDVSSGGTLCRRRRSPSAPGYQVPFARRIRRRGGDRDRRRSA